MSLHLPLDPGLGVLSPADLRQPGALGLVGDGRDAGEAALAEPSGEDHAAPAAVVGGVGEQGDARLGAQMLNHRGGGEPVDQQGAQRTARIGSVADLGVRAPRGAFFLAQLRKHAAHPLECGQGHRVVEHAQGAGCSQPEGLSLAEEQRRQARQ